MTKPIPGILTREITEEINEEYCAKTSRLLKEIANFGTHVFHIFTQVTKNKYKPYENRAMLSQILRTIEIVDTIQNLLSVGIATPSTFQVRTLFETYLTVRLLIEDEKEYAIRSILWEQFCIHQNISVYQEFANGNLRNIDNNNYVKLNIDFEDYEKKAVNNIEKLTERLKQERFQKNECLFNAPGRKPFQWYAYVNPRFSNLRELAIKFNCESEYFFVYKPFSAHIHATDYFHYEERFLTSPPPKYILHDRKYLQQVAGFTGTFTLTMFYHIFNKMLKERMDSYRDWYIREMQGKFLDIWKSELVFE